MPFLSDPASVLLDVSSACAALGCRWYVFGAQAVIIWGRPRMTTDVDVTVLLGSVDTASLVAALQGQRFRLSDEFSDQFVRVTRVLPMRHEPTGLALDTVLGGPGLEEQFVDRAIAVDISGCQVPVISPEDLIVTKAFAGRPKDLEDVRGVLAIQLAKLDLEYIRTTLESLEDALGQSDLLPVFEKALEAVR